jgi:hypothetical protein
MRTSLLPSELQSNVDVDKIRIRLAEEIALKWNESNIHYAVVNGLSEYPQKLGRDLDVVVNQNEAQRVLKIIEEIGKAKGFLNFSRWSYFGLYQSVLVKIEGNEVISLPIDLLCTDYVWRSKFINLTNSDEILNSAVSYKGPFKESEYGKYLKNIIRPFLCGDVKRFQTKYKAPIKIPESLVSHKLVALFGNRGLKTIQRVLGNQYNHIAGNIAFIKLKLQMLYFLKHPIKFIRSAFRMLFTRIMLLIINRPVYLAILAEDNNMYDYLKPLNQWLSKGFLAIDIKNIDPDFLNKNIGLYGSLKSKLYHLWRNWIKDNRIPISEVRVIIRLYITSVDNSELIKEISKIKKTLLSNAVIVLAPNKLLFSFPDSNGKEMLFDELYVTKSNKEEFVYLIGSSIINHFPKIIR